MTQCCVLLIWKAPQAGQRTALLAFSSTYCACTSFHKRTKQNSLHLYVEIHHSIYSLLSSAKSVASNNVLQSITSNFVCITNSNDPYYYPDQQKHNICILKHSVHRKHSYTFRYRPATSSVHYTTSCNTQSSAPEDV